MHSAGRGIDSQAARQRWLLINVDAGGAPASVIGAWRRLRALGALYLQPSVCLLPERPETHRPVERIVARVQRAGGSARVFPVGLLDADDEPDVIAAFSAERSDEYDQVVDRTRHFLEEISKERGHRRVSYIEVEEAQADLRRLRRWLTAIHRRDYFDAPGHAEAQDAVARCEHALAEFEAEVFAVEVHPTEDDLANTPWRLRLRSLGGPPRR